MFEFPEWLRFSIQEPFNIGIDWLLINLSNFFDAFSKVVLSFFRVIQIGLGFVPWWVYLVVLFFAGWKLYSWKMAIMLTSMLFAIGLFGMWEQMLYTLTIIIISVFVSVMLGLPLGILMAKNNRIERILKPLLDGMQTMPSFVYLIPAVMLLGLGKVSAVLATIIYALPPLIRLTYLGISQVDKEVIEAGKAFGSTTWQLLVKVELPQALSTIMAGVNQTTMMAMSMVVIASMIGAEGIGEEVLIAIRRLDVGRGFQAGFAVVFLAIILDRLLQGSANKLKQGD